MTKSSSSLIPEEVLKYTSDDQERIWNSIKLIIKKGSLRKDGTCIVFIQYCRTSEDRVLVDTGVAIPPKYWNRKTGRISEDLPIQFGKPALLQQLLTKQLRKAEDMVEYALKKEAPAL